MNLNRYRKSLSKFFPVACAILLAASLFANSLNQLQEKPDSLRVPVELVLVPVSVEDGDGRLIAGLLKEDFELLEDGIEPMSDRGELSDGSHRQLTSVHRTSTRGRRVIPAGGPCDVDSSTSRTDGTRADATR